MDGLRERLLAPELVEEFARGFQEEVNRLAAEKTRHRAADEGGAAVVGGVDDGVATAAHPAPFRALPSASRLMTILTSAWRALTASHSSSLTMRSSGTGTIKQLATLRDDRPQRAEVVASLVDLRKLIERVYGMAGSPDDVTWSSLSRAEEELHEECVWGESPAMREVGAMWDSGDGEVTFYTQDDCLPVMRYMRLLLGRALEKAPSSKRGQKRQEPVRQWAKPILDFWERDLGKKVTYEHFYGEAITETHQFLEALLRPLDASASRYLGTVLEEERTARRRR